MKQVFADTVYSIALANPFCRRFMTASRSFESSGYKAAYTSSPVSNGGKWSDFSPVAPKKPRRMRLYLTDERITGAVAAWMTVWILCWQAGSATVSFKGRRICIMMIHLSGQREQLILSLLQAGKFTSSEEVIDEGLRLVEEALSKIWRAERIGGQRRGG